MKIAIDISSVIYGTGVSVYTKELVTNLLKIDKKNEYLLYGSSLRRRDELKDFIVPLLSKKVQGKIFPLAPTLADIVWNKLHGIPIEQIIGKVDVFHSSDWTQPPTAGLRITTVHDVIPLKYPEWSHKRIIAAHTKRMQHVRREAEAIIVPSKQTKKDLIDLGYEAKKIHVIYEAASSAIAKIGKDKQEKIFKKMGIKGNFLLSVGITPRKNSLKIVKAFKNIEKKNLSMVFVGNPVGVEIPEADNIHVLGHVTDEELSALYSGAEALIYPSLYEGFGIPILDAMKCGTPVVTSDLGSMKEVAGSAAVLVDPTNLDSITEGIRKALKNKKGLVAKGRKRVKQFSWEKMAKETLELYESTK